MKSVRNGRGGLLFELEIRSASLHCKWFRGFQIQRQGGTQSREWERMDITQLQNGLCERWDRDTSITPELRDFLAALALSSIARVPADGEGAGSTGRCADAEGAGYASRRTFSAPQILTPSCFF